MTATRIPLLAGVPALVLSQPGPSTCIFPSNGATIAGSFNDGGTFAIAALTRLAAVCSTSA